MEAYPNLDIGMRIAECITVCATCGVLVWYTIETRRIRLATRLQANLLDEQMRMLKRREAPKFCLDHMENNSFQVLKCYLKNLGGTAIGLSASASEPVGARLQPQHTIIGGQILEIELHRIPDPRPASIPVVLAYRDTFGEEHKTSIVFDSSRGSFEVEAG